MTEVAQVSLGIDQLVASRALVGRRVGLVCNPASVDSAFRHSADRVHDADGVTLTALFGPQHGFRSDVQDNMVETSHARHRRFDVPIYSLYGDQRGPTSEMLDEIDVLVIDLQDVGTRVYTYVYTMANCLRAAARHDLSVIVCDRPNPIGGTLVEGPLLESGYESFVGQFQIPLCHGMTIGELACLFNVGIGAELKVSRLEGWERHVYHDGTDLPWIMPSPNLPTLESARSLSWHRPVRGDQSLRGTRNDATVRAGWGTVDRRSYSGRRTRTGHAPWGGHPTDAFRAHVSEARR